MDAVFGVEQKCEFSDRHTVPLHNGKISRKGAVFEFQYIPLDGTTDWVRPVEHDKLLFVSRTFFHCIRHRGNIGIKTGADILNIKAKHIDIFQHLLRRALGVPVKAVHRKSRLRVGAVLDGCTLPFVSLYAVFGRKKRCKLYRPAQQHGRGYSSGIDTGLVGNQPYPFPGKNSAVVRQPLNSQFKPVLRNGLSAHNTK